LYQIEHRESKTQTFRERERERTYRHEFERERESLPFWEKKNDNRPIKLKKKKTRERERSFLVRERKSLLEREGNVKFGPKKWAYCNKRLWKRNGVEWGLDNGVMFYGNAR